MKRIFLLLFAVFIYLSATAQIKHNKFTTTIKFAKNNPTFEFGGTAIAELKDQSGYFLSNRYNDQIGGFHPSIVKLDIDGNIVLDSIYNFISINNNGSTEFFNSTTSLTSHTMLYSTESMAQPSLIISGPYLVNTDYNGNLNWHVGMQDDTFDLEPSAIINTQDGGYAIIGKMEDPVLNSNKEAGMIIKLDGNGNYMWDKFYRSTDTLGFHFDNGIETPDGGILVVGEAPLYHENAKSYLLAAKMNSTGVVIWSKILKLATPIDPVIAPDKISVGLLNNTDAFISYEQHDTTGGNYKVPVLTSINVNTGVNNWTKTYSFPSEPELARATSDGKGNILLHAMDSIDQSVIYRFDDNGNYIGAKSFMTNLPVPFSHFPFVTIPTIDGGFIHTNGMFQNQLLVVKTDKDLDPSCPAIDSLYPFTLTANLNIDTSVFGVLDSVFVLPNLTPITLVAGTPFNTVADDSVICSCSNTITGTVLDNSLPVNGAKVFLFKKGVVPKPWAPIDSMVTGVAGTYMFNYVPTDSFLVKVKPNPLFNPNSMNSYHKHLDTCYRWESAGVFYAHCDSGAVVKDVTLITPPLLTGNSSLNGFVREYSGSFNKMAPGDPIPGIDITVEQSPGGIVGGSTSGGNGYYDLSNINSSATYIVSIDYPGLPHDSIWTVAINFNDSILDSLNFYVDSTGIYILLEPLGTGITVANEANLELELYPNPTNGPATLMITAIKPKDIFIDITNEVGKIISTTIERVNSGVNKISLNTDNLSSGIYFIKVREKGKLYVRKLIKY